MPTLISRDPLIGILELDTDTDPIELAMNRKVAERLMSTVVEFLQAAERADAPTFGGRAVTVIRNCQGSRFRSRKPAQDGGNDRFGRLPTIEGLASIRAAAPGCG
jgi:hypothetical protein